MEAIATEQKSKGGRPCRVAGSRSGRAVKTYLTEGEAKALDRARELERRGDAAILRDALLAYLGDSGLVGC